MDSNDVSIIKIVLNKDYKLVQEKGAHESEPEVFIEQSIKVII